MELQNLMDLRDEVIGFPEATGGSGLGDSDMGFAGEFEAARIRSAWNDYFIYIGTTVIGTGGQLQWPIRFEAMLESAAPTGAALLLYIPKAPSSNAAIRTVSDEVAEIKAAFGLSISQLADVLRVKRPTIYSWIDSARVRESLRKENRERLLLLREFAEMWNKRGQMIVPGKYLTASVGQEDSLLDLLSAPRLRVDRISEAMDSVCAALHQTAGEERRSFGEQLRGMGFADRPSLTRPPKLTGG